LEEEPFSPWRSRDELSPGQLAELDSRPESVLDELWLALFADLYRALAHIMSPAEADECELWQLATLLGRDRPDERPEADIDRLAARIEAEREGLIERARKAGTLREGTEEKPAGPIDVTDEIMRSMGISTR